MSEVADDDVRAAAQVTDLFGHVVQLGLGAGGNDDVGAHFGERHRDGGTEAAARAGDHSHLIIEPEFIEDHRGHGNKADDLADRISAGF